MSHERDFTRSFVDQLIDLCDEAVWLWGDPPNKPTAEVRARRIAQLKHMREHLLHLRNSVERE
jgi:hypothetical protein